GLVNGFAIPAMQVPKAGLSAHLAAVQSGTFLIAVGAIWSRIAPPAPWSGIIANGLWISLYMLWLGLLTPGIFGIGQHGAASVLLAIGSFGTLAAVAAAMVRWRWRD
ncbi:MAG: hypothetical protein ABI655_04000, partial [Phenylobacterium sp.]